MPADSELRVHDDGSSDDTLAVLAEFQDPRLVVSSGPKCGVAATLNGLIAAGDSARVARMDADDICAPWRFARQSTLIERADVVFSSVTKLRGRGLRPETPGHVDVNGTPFHLLASSFLCHPTMYALRRALPDVPYRPIAAEDYDLWLRLAAAGRGIVRDAVPGLVYRLHEGQVSASTAWDAARIEDVGIRLTEESYADLAERLRVPVVPTPSLVYFAESLKVGAESAHEVRHALTAISQVARRSLSRIQYAQLSVRVRLLLRRLP